MGARENERQISKNYILPTKFSEFYPYNHNSCEIWHLFSRTSMRNFLWCYYGWFITSVALEKCKKECNFLLTILVQDFRPLKIKITQFPDGFRLKFVQAFITISCLRVFLVRRFWLADRHAPVLRQIWNWKCSITYSTKEIHLQKLFRCKTNKSCTWI